MVAARLANLDHGGDRGANQHGARQDANLQVATTQADASRMLNVSERSVATAKVIEREGTPELVAAVDAGKVSVSAAAVIAKQDQDTQRRLVAGVFHQRWKMARFQKRDLPYVHPQ